MDWNGQLKEIIDYTEDHLQKTQEPLNKDEIARMAGCSYAFFQKVFSYMNNISFSEYIRSRKMTLAGYDLKSTSIKVVDLSYKYGYDSPTSFTKAFQQFHGMSPSDARSDNADLKVFPKMTFTSQDHYVWRLERKQKFRLIGKGSYISYSENQHYQKIPEFWHYCQQDGTFSRLISMDEADKAGLMGLCSTSPDDTNGFYYYLMVNSSQSTPDGFTELIIPEVTWAVFDCIGPNPQAIQKGWNFLNEEWLVKYPFKHADCPEIEWHSAGSPFAEDYLSQIWIPVLEEE